MKVWQAGSHLSEERGGTVGDWSWRQTRRRIAMLIGLALPYKARTAGAVVSLFAYTLVALVPPLLAKLAVDQGIKTFTLRESTTIMANHLAQEQSPYLLQHADNTVDWYPWGDSAFEKARREDKPVFLSVGYATCHWCHVMAHESFEDDAVAKVLNDAFVAIKVDREERPDVDQIYMTVCQAMTGRGGWPLNVFLTPEGKPFFAGTYFPREERMWMPGFTSILPRSLNCGSLIGPSFSKSVKI